MLGSADTNVIPVGRLSNTMTLVAVAFDSVELAAVIVYEIVWPSFGVSSSTVFVTDRFTELTVTSSMSVLSPGFGSVWSPMISAVLGSVMPVVPVSTVAVITRVSTSPMGSSAIVHLPVWSS